VDAGDGARVVQQESVAMGVSRLVSSWVVFSNMCSVSESVMSRA
jgi:hypothetical protein